MAAAPVLQTERNEEIRRLAADGVPLKRLARDFGLSRQRVVHILHGTRQQREAAAYRALVKAGKAPPVGVRNVKGGADANPG